MNQKFSNVYNDALRADAYSKLEFPGTYYLAFRDLPRIIGEPRTGSKALDFGCGTGRSSRFLRDLGFETVGVDIAGPMIAQARERDPQGDYLMVNEGDLRELESKSFDVILAAFTFDNIPTPERKVQILQSLNRVMKDGGRMVILVSSPEIYCHEWASFSTRDYPENRTAQSGDRVRIVMLDVEDSRPVEDILWTDMDYQEIYDRAGLVPASIERPMGKDTEPHAWVNETKISPWVIYELNKKSN